MQGLVIMDQDIIDILYMNYYNMMNISMYIYISTIWISEYVYIYGIWKWKEMDDIAVVLIYGIECGQENNQYVGFSDKCQTLQSKDRINIGILLGVIEAILHSWVWKLGQKWSAHSIFVEIYL